MASVELEGCNNLSNSAGYIEFTNSAHADGTVSFDWTYETFDDSGNGFFDPAFFVLNGVVTQLPIDGGAISQTGIGARRWRQRRRG